MIFPTFFQRFDVESLCSSSGAFAALRRDGAVRCWGDAALGGHGEAGDGDGAGGHAGSVCGAEVAVGGLGDNRFLMIYHLVI